MVSPHLTDVVAAGGSDGLVDHLLTHDAVECLLDTTQQTSLREGNKANEYTVQHNATEYGYSTLNSMITNKAALCFLKKVLTYNNIVTVRGKYCMLVHVPIS